jgi:hypothetical protein
MKRIFLSILALLTINLANGQDEVVTYKVTNYELNGVNYDDLALSSDVAVSFYMCNDETLCFANQWRNNDSQSYGGVYALKKTNIPETSTTYEADEFKFTWKFLNTYDNVAGEAAVTFTIVYIVSTVKFKAEILVLKTNDFLVLEGYME